MESDEKMISNKFIPVQGPLIRQKIWEPPPSYCLFFRCPSLIFLLPRPIINERSLNALSIELSGPDLSPCRGHCDVLLGKTLYSQSAFLHPGVQMGTSLFNAGGSLVN